MISHAKNYTLLWFDGQAEEAVEFYLSVFRKARRTMTTHYGEDGPGEKGSVMTVAFELEGVEFVALNGGPQFKFNEAVSFVVNCENQEEIDDYWEKLQAGGGQEIECGWLKDKFGVCWQIVPGAFWEMMKDKDQARTERVMKALMTMRKLDLARLEEAYREN